MTFTEAVKSGFSKYVQFSGRAARSEYWWWTLFSMLVQVVLQVGVTAIAVAAGPGSETLVMVFSGLLMLVVLALILPSISVLVRRLHDIDRSGWWYWIILVPLVGVILLLVWFCKKGTTGPNRFGQDPLGGASDDTEGFAPSSIPNVS